MMVDQTAERSEQGESRLTVFVALAANAGIGLLKLIAGLLSGSGAMLAEAAHSVGDPHCDRARRRLGARCRAHRGRGRQPVRPQPVRRRAHAVAADGESGRAPATEGTAGYWIVFRVTE